MRRQIFRYSSNIFFFLMFIFERVRETKEGPAGVGAGGGERFPSGLHADSREPNVGIELTNCEITI